MDLTRIKGRLFSTRQRGTASFTLPAVVLEIQPEFVAGVRLEGASRTLRRMGVRELESRPIEPLPHQPNFVKEADVHPAVREVLDVVGNGNGRLGLLVPDGVVRVGMLHFETLPDDHAEIDALVRWRMRDLLPFPPEEVRLSCQVVRREPDSIELLAMAARNSVLAEYETAVELLNGGPSLILPATAALLPLLPEGDENGQLLVHLCSGWLTTVVVVGSRLAVWRNRELGRKAEQEIAEETAREGARVLASAQDRLKVDIPKVWLCSRPLASSELITELARAVGRPVEILAPGADLAASLPAGERALFERFGAAVAGLMSNSS